MLRKFFARTVQISIALCLGACVFGQQLKIGDNIKTEYSKLTKHYFFAAPNLSGWAEGDGMILIGAKPNANDCNFLFLALKDKTLIGALKNTNPKAFYVDLDGKNILTTASEFFILPEWVIKRKAHISPTDRRVYNLLDRLYEETLQADDNQLDQKTMDIYQKFQTDTSMANRHLMLLFDTYQNIVSETASKQELSPGEICVALMKKLAAECNSVYKNIPAIVYVYLGEALESAGSADEARKQFKLALQFYPESVPLQVHNYILEQDAEKKKQQLAELKAKHPNHWMVQDL